MLSNSVAIFISSLKVVLCISVGGGQHRSVIHAMSQQTFKTCVINLASFLFSFLDHMIITGFTEVVCLAIRKVTKDLQTLVPTRIWPKFSKGVSVLVKKFFFVVQLYKTWKSHSTIPSTHNTCPLISSIWNQQLQVRLGLKQIFIKIL